MLVENIRKKNPFNLIQSTGININTYFFTSVKYSCHARILLWRWRMLNKIFFLSYMFSSIFCIRLNVNHPLCVWGEAQSKDSKSKNIQNSICITLCHLNTYIEHGGFEYNFTHTRQRNSTMKMCTTYNIQLVLSKECIFRYRHLKIFLQYYMETYQVKKFIIIFRFTILLCTTFVYTLMARNLCYYTDVRFGASKLLLAFIWITLTLFAFHSVALQTKLIEAFSQLCRRPLGSAAIGQTALNLLKTYPALAQMYSECQM